MDDSRYFLLSLLSKHWNSGSIQVPWNPGWQTYFPTHGQLRDNVPIVSIVLTPYPIITHGLPGRVHSGKKALLVSFWDVDDSHKQFFEDETTRVIMDNTDKPTTDEFPDPGIDFMQITSVDDNDDYTFSPVVFRRDIEVLIHYQENYR